MKNAVIITVAIAVIAVAGYSGIPVLMKKETAGLRSEVNDLKQRLQRIEDESKVAPLQLDADAQKIIKTVNAISLMDVSLELQILEHLSLR